MNELFRMFVRLSLDQTEFDEDTKKVETKAGKLGEKLKGGLAKVASTIAKATVAALAAAGAGIAAVAKMAVSSYGEYQQLEGGVKKLYGNMGMSLEEYAATVGKSTDEVRDKWEQLETAQNLVLENAQKAYKTAGMSANEYMNIATSFSAALINSLEGDTVKAAEQTDKAMTAIADNFNTFGGDIGMIQGAFQGFAKQNYTMLDNLKLGYGGTKKEMQRLIADANEYAESIGMASDLSIDSFSDIVTAIDLIQQKQGIAGTTAREAATTIEGSVNTAKAAWQNLLTAFGSGEGVDEAINSFVDSASVVIKNVLPVFKQALSGIGRLVGEIAPIISEQLPGLVAEVLPDLLDAAVQLVSGVVSAIPGIMQAIWDTIGKTLDTFGEWLNQRFPTLGKAFEGLRETATTALGKISDFWNTTLKPALEELFNYVSENIGPLMDKLSSFWNETLKPIFEGIVTFVTGTIVPALSDFFKMVSENMDKIIPVIMAVIGAIAGAKIAGVIMGIVGAVSTAITVIQNLVAALGMIKSFSGLVSVITTLAGGPLVLIVAAIGAVTAAFIYLWNTSEGFRNFWIGLWDNVQQIVSGAVEWVTTTFTGFVEGASAILTGFKDGVMAIFTGIRDGIGAAAEWIHTNVVDRFTSLKDSATERVQALKDAAAEKFANIKDKATTLITDAKNAVVDRFNEMKSSAEEKAGAIYTAVSGKFSEIKSAIEEKINGARDAVGAAIDRIKGFFDFEWSLPHLKLPHPYISGSFSLNPPSVPSFGIDWYGKAMNKGYLLDGATIFGDNAGKLLGGGEAGKEIVIGQGYFERVVTNAVRSLVMGREGGAPGDTIVINVYPSEKMDERTLAEEVGRELARIEAQKRAVFA